MLAMTNRNGRRPSGVSVPDPAVASASHEAVSGYAAPGGTIGGMVSEADFIAAQDISTGRVPAPAGDPAVPERRRYPLAGLLICGTCGRRMESAWANAKPAYRCRHGHTSATPPDPGRTKNAYVREDRLLPQLPALHLLLTGADPGPRRRRRTRRGVDAPSLASAEDVIGYLRKNQVTLT